MELFQKRTIKVFLATLILVVYAYSITPKIFLHNLIADHTDNREVFNCNTELSAVGFNCKCDNLVAESPFIAEDAVLYSSATLYFPYYTKPAISFLSFDKFFSELRGPPVV